MNTIPHMPPVDAPRDVSQETHKETHRYNSSMVQCLNAKLNLSLTEFPDERRILRGIDFCNTQHEPSCGSQTNPAHL